MQAKIYKGKSFLFKMRQPVIQEVKKFCKADFRKVYKKV